MLISKNSIYTSGRLGPEGAIEIFQNLGGQWYEGVKAV